MTYGARNVAFEACLAVGNGEAWLLEQQGSAALKTAALRINLIRASVMATHSEGSLRGAIERLRNRVSLQGGFQLGIGGEAWFLGFRLHLIRRH
jgi:hypothetical protein